MVDFDLERFVSAQDTGGSYQQAVRELRRGRKTSHWIWWVFPQIAGLGQSPTSREYALADVDEAGAYLAHPVLGQRLRDATTALLAAPGDDPVAILGDIDAVKVRSSMTLFAATDPAEPVFQQVLDRFYDGQPDLRTISLITG
ncbi:uncharacterized protein (DUF1810 family) [Branchiibius hedensis]|uniref:Uncharacterized protein, DUF1810 family n=1 Tax=Branchiibius hedensis TaxID=672460 RepID=A0A2Y8ZUT9_9MICO|nr:DUF1810 domain-containing protein [Branchiibius hedensis]PWJ24821.1 uncharacterized protein (DUF1810 family) [Branchiibius hedensis]SSA33637.1 Uncharacterized protein, DUF1810 family [Branchiibius hedensis]